LKFTDNIAEELVLACLKEGLLVNAVKPNTLRFIPPLIITKKDIDEALRILEKVLARRL
jgi:4-aminobutyrate aminotransferase-like enzyme